MRTMHCVLLLLLLLCVYKANTSLLVLPSRVSANLLCLLLCFQSFSLELQVCAPTAVNGWERCLLLWQVSLACFRALVLKPGASLFVPVLLRSQLSTLRPFGLLCCCAAFACAAATRTVGVSVVVLYINIPGITSERLLLVGGCGMLVRRLVGLPACPEGRHYAPSYDTRLGGLAQTHSVRTNAASHSEPC